MSDRFFCEEPVTGDSALLSGAEAHHLLHVMRAKAGDAITLFDGSGAEFDAEVATASRSSVEARVLARREVDRERPRPLVLAVALPKGDRQKVLVEKLTELGVSRLIPLVTERTVAKLSGGALDKLRRGVIEASKQCGRNVLMTIDEPMSFADAIGAAPENANRLVAHPGEAEADAGPDAAELWRLVGPEGGFTDAEVAAAEAAGWSRASLGRAILRTETAAIALAAREP
ncbi:Ribosomal RNA small subunit methyltransferase E [Posidoniimonas polymericola]|uniref:Ribosomal RNA small subunit methyltransferase E n=1 Tax=Posidoniimonas polymericola TaxID=2528002 RepID=A0A5C5YL79_9BACT|nr:RsmE family RNA methyltransferase [Posidoniimonas polymericola]TWT75626.1 Ribosomal RNA small subunit methyltransferase E [Posidoniimonas polymericola]